MALQNSPGGQVFIPQLMTFGAIAPTYASGSGGLLDASGEKWAFIFRVPKTGTLDKFEFRIGTATQVPANGFKCSFQDMDLTTGFPDGTADQFRVVTGLAANTWTVPGLITSDGTDGGVKRSVTRGDYLCGVIEFQSFSASDSANISLWDPGSATANRVFATPYPALFTAAWVSSTGAGAVFALKYDDGTYETIGGENWPVSAFNTTTFNSGSTPDERGLKFQLPYTAKVGGLWVRCDLDGDSDFVLYDSDGTSVLATVSADKDFRQATAGQSFYIPFPTPATILANTFYRLVAKPGGTNISTYDFDVNAAAIMGSFAGGTNFHYTSRTDAGAWTDTTTKRMWIGLEITAFDDGAGGGGGSSVAIF